MALIHVVPVNCLPCCAMCCCCHSINRFVYERNQLTNTAAPQPKGTTPGVLNSNLVIEKVIILGLDPASTYTAAAGSSKFPGRSGVGIDPRMRQGKGVMLRTVSLPLNEDWSLKITQGGGVAQQ